MEQELVLVRNQPGTDNLSPFGQREGDVGRKSLAGCHLAAPHDEDTWVIVLRPDREPQACHGQIGRWGWRFRRSSARRRCRGSTGGGGQCAYVRYRIPYLLLGKLVPKSRHDGG